MRSTNDGVSGFGRDGIIYEARGPFRTTSAAKSPITKAAMAALADRTGILR